MPLDYTHVSHNSSWETGAVMLPTTPTHLMGMCAYYIFIFPDADMVLKRWMICSSNILLVEHSIHSVIFISLLHTLRFVSIHFPLSFLAMPHSILYSIAGFGLLGHWSTASPLNIARPDSSSHNTGGNTVQAVSRSNGLHERQDLEVIGPTFEGRWPLQPLDFPFPANVSIHADTEASPNDMPPNIDPQNQDVEVLSRREISKAFIENSCSADQKAQVLAAWEEARDLAEAQTKIEYGFDYNTIHTNWLGVDWNSESRQEILTRHPSISINKVIAGFLGARISVNETKVLLYLALKITPCRTNDVTRQLGSS